ncbi:MAG: DUF2203 family protein [Gemmataceae bacterium]|nr:DUF2203 family protein [Gemmataceae bacterium]
MNGSAENRASDATEKSGRREIVLNLGTARRMLPLVARIVGDLTNCQQRLDCLVPELETLDRKRHSLAWPQRERRYQVRDEVTEQERLLRNAHAELEQLGVAVIDTRQGRIGLPTVVNGHLAFFSWLPGDEGIRHWHFAGETVRRSIPTSWKDTGDVRLLGKS